MIFTRYLGLGSLTALIAELDRTGTVTKVSPRRDGSVRGGIRFGKGGLAALLKNRCYVGEVIHKGRHYPGEHQAVVDPAVFAVVQDKLAASASRTGQPNRISPALLTGLVFDDRGNRMTPSTANKRGLRYRYYVSCVLAQGRKAEAGNRPRIAAPSRDPRLWLTVVARNGVRGCMLTGELRGKIDAVWNAFWAGGIANPIEVIEQITYLLFMRGLDDAQTLAENKANRTGRPIERRIFPEGKDGLGKDEGVAYADMRWSRLKNLDPATMFTIVADHVFPFLRAMGEEGSAHATHMKGARFTIPTPALLAKVVDLIADIPMEDRDTKGDLYEYMLSKIASAGQNGQFRTPRHIIDLMVEMTAPTPKDIICDPACGTCGFLFKAGEYLRDTYPRLLHDPESRAHFNAGMFHGFDFDGTMLRIGSMNMVLHGVEDPDIRYKDSLAQEHAGDADRYSLVLANPPFAGSLDYETTAKDLQRIVKTKKTELLFMALFLKLLKPGGRAAVIVPDGVLFGSSTAHKAIRRMLVEDHKLDGIVKLPSGVFRPYAGVSTAIVFFTKTNSGGTDQVWFYDCRADGFSLDDKRTPSLPPDKIGPNPGRREGSIFVSLMLDEAEAGKNDLPDIAARWAERAGTERARPRTAQSFCVPKAEIAAANYDLSLNRYKEVVHEAAEHRPPKEIIAELKALEAEIAEGLDELEAML